MNPSGIVTLTTDFGLDDWYVGAMKGVVLSIHPRAVIIDLSHGVPPGDAFAAALALRCSYRFFPRGTVHVVVVDPGVGGEREILCAESAGHLFIAPDNGILPLALGEAVLAGMRAVRNRAFRLPEVSRTFHGRDILAPAAAHVARGVPWRRLGPPFRGAVLPAEPSPRRTARGTVRARVIHVDRFGNLITDIPDGSPLLPPPGDAVFAVGGRRIRGISGCYSDAAPGALIALRGSSGYIEIAVRGGDAARELRAARGTPVILKKAL
ncbi:MAG: SAM-dependent chlorinase/fluorinase [bacterium]|nr:SAM-dependent chlorinase/fluorinase [bacterium]